MLQPCERQMTKRKLWRGSEPRQVNRHTELTGAPRVVTWPKSPLVGSRVRVSPCFRHQEIADTPRGGPMRWIAKEGTRPLRLALSLLAPPAAPAGAGACPAGLLRDTGA